MENLNFYAMLARMKYINRWGLMNNTRTENISEHSLQVAIFAHALVLIDNERFSGKLNPEHAALLGIFHDVSEIITGDLPTPIKYGNPDVMNAYKGVEQTARESLLSKLPEDLRRHYAEIFSFEQSEPEYYPFVKAADKLSALVKCIEEIRLGNTEFTSAKQTLETAVEQMDIPAVKVFVGEFMPAFYLTLDEQ